MGVAHSLASHRISSHLSPAGLPVSVAAGEVAAAHARVDYVRHVLHCALRDRPPGGRRARHVRRLLLRQGRRHLRLRGKAGAGVQSARLCFYPYYFVR